MTYFLRYSLTICSFQNKAAERIARESVVHFLANQHCVKSFCIRIFSDLNAGKYGPGKLQIQTLFRECSCYDVVDLGYWYIRKVSFFRVPHVVCFESSIIFPPASLLLWKNKDLYFYDPISRHCAKSVQIRSFFWSVFSFIRTELLRKSPYSVPIQENTDQKDSVFGHFPHSTNEVEFGRKFSIQQALKDLQRTYLRLPLDWLLANDLCFN